MGVKAGLRTLAVGAVLLSGGAAQAELVTVSLTGTVGADAYDRTGVFGFEANTRASLQSVRARG